MTDWNERYTRGDTPWEKGRAAPPLLELFSRTDPGLWGCGPILVPGCGTGHDVRALATLGLPILGLDLAEEAVSRADAYAKVAHETYAHGDFLDPLWRGGKSFSAIWEHTCYCAINPARRPDYAESCAELIQSGGHLIGVFYLTPNQPGEEHQGPPFNATIDELDARFSPWFTREDGWVPENSYPGREGQEWIGIYRRK